MQFPYKNPEMRTALVDSGIAELMFRYAFPDMEDEKVASLLPTYDFFVTVSQKESQKGYWGHVHMLRLEHGKHKGGLISRYDWINKPLLLGKLKLTKDQGILLGDMVIDLT